MLSQISETHYPELIFMSLYSITCAMEKTLGERRSVDLLPWCAIQFSKPVKANKSSKWLHRLNLSRYFSVYAHIRRKMWPYWPELVLCSAIYLMAGNGYLGVLWDTWKISLLFSPTICTPWSIKDLLLRLWICLCTYKPYFVRTYLWRTYLWNSYRTAFVLFKTVCILSSD